MFENIIGQNKAVHRLKNDWENGTLPGSLLFEGPEFSGKMTSALELARVVTCRESGEWTCGCSSCEQHRLLAYGDLLFLGSRNFIDEIRSASEALIRDGSKGSRFLFIRNLRKLMRRFDSVLWEDQEKKRQQVDGTIEKLNSVIDVLSPGRPLPERKIIQEHLTNAVQWAETLAKAVPSGIPIHQVRNIRSWSHQSSSGSAKVAILENAETMQDGARNALLKLLEEPPADLYLILTSQRKNLIIPTILSRVRSYRFSERMASGVKEVLERVYREENVKAESLQEYFYQHRNMDIDNLRVQVHHFVEAVLAREPMLPELDSGKGMDSGYLILWLHELEKELNIRLKKNLSDKSIPYNIFENWTNQIRSVQEGVEIFNQNTALLRETLFYRMRGVL